MAGSSFLEQLVNLRELVRKGGDRKKPGRSRGMWDGGLKTSLREGRRVGRKDKDRKMGMHTVLTHVLGGSLQPTNRHKNFHGAMTTTKKIGLLDVDFCLADRLY